MEDGASRAAEERHHLEATARRHTWTLDNEISALDSQETDARGAAALAQNGEERNRLE